MEPRDLNCNKYLISSWFRCYFGRNMRVDNLNSSIHSCQHLFKQRSCCYLSLSEAKGFLVTGSLFPRMPFCTTTSPFLSFSVKVCINKKIRQRTDVKFCCGIWSQTLSDKNYMYIFTSCFSPALTWCNFMLNLHYNFMLTFPRLFFFLLFIFCSSSSVFVFSNSESISILMRPLFLHIWLIKNKNSSDPCP